MYDVKPSLGKNVRIAENATVLGNVKVGDNTGIWYNAVIRCEESSIEIGANSNIQDGCILHVDPDNCIKIGDYVTVGHAAILHGCTIGDNTLVGMGSIVMNNANIGSNCVIGAGALVLENMTIPDGSLVVGSPAKIARKLGEADYEKIKLNAQHYVLMAEKYII